MNNKKTYLKIGVLTGFVLTVLLFVSYRAGALHRIFSDGSIVMPVDSPPPGRELTGSSQSDTAATPDNEEEIMFSGSKSGQMFWVDPETKTTTRVSDTFQERTMMNSTKAGFIIPPSDSVFEVKLNQQQSPVNQGPPPKKANNQNNINNSNQR